MASPDNTSDSRLFDMLVVLLVPLFLEGTGNADLARLAAAETLNAWGVRNRADLLAVAQIIAFGLAAIGSLGLSMSDGISLPMVLRLRGNANALTRSAQKQQADLERRRQARADAEHREKAAREHERMANAALQQAREDARNSTPAAQAGPKAPQRPTPRTPAPESFGAQAALARSFARVAAQMADEMPHLSPADRELASLRVAALSSTASELLAEGIPRTTGPSA